MVKKSSVSSYVVSKSYLTYICPTTVFLIYLSVLVLEFLTSECAVNLISLRFFACLYQPSDLRKHRRKVKFLVVEHPSVCDTWKRAPHSPGAHPGCVPACGTHVRGSAGPTALQCGGRPQITATDGGWGSRLSLTCVCCSLHTWLYQT